MSISFLLLSQIRINKYYKLVTFNEDIRMSDIQIGKTNKKNVYQYDTLGKLLEIRNYGRMYDTDILLVFKMSNGETIEYEPSFCCKEAFIEYEPDTEEYSKNRIQARTSILRNDIINNEWAFRPENVLTTQDIDISKWSEKK